MNNINAISISYGNKKMGDIPSVSLPPIITCAKNCPCAAKCYAAKLCRIYPTVRAAYNRNLDILENDFSSYWLQVKAAASVTRFFRYHVSGDIPNAAYLEKMVETAEELPHTEFLAFTKRFDIVNDYINFFGDLPENLHIIFSDWKNLDMPNPYNMPVAHVIFKGENPLPDWKICNGNCAACAVAGQNCWSLKNGEHIAFYEH